MGEENTSNTRVSEYFITNWFHAIIPLKCAMILWSAIHLNKYSEHAIKKVEKCLCFIKNIEYHKYLVLADEKKFLRKEIFGRNKRDPFSWKAPPLQFKDAISRKRHNTFIMVKLNKENASSSLVCKENGDS